MAIKAALFDLFETLISEFQDGGAKRNGGYDVGLGLSPEQFRREWRARQARRMNGSLRNFPEVLREILQAAGKPVDEHLIERIYQERIAEKRVPFLSVNKSVLTMLAELKNSGMKLAVISNCTEEEVRGWPECPLPPYFDEVIFSYMTGCAKPERRIYDTCCDKLGVRPEQCLFVGDGGSNELDGASAAGITALQAVWFLPETDQEKTTGYPKLRSPLDLIAHTPG